ncbi:hypothetical protein HpBT223_07280 [Helicobacter pylori]
MHKIERLLQTLVPKGVEFRKLGEVCEIIRGKRVTKKEILDKGKYPVVSGGIGFMGYLNEYKQRGKYNYYSSIWNCRICQLAKSKVLGK